MIQGSGFKFDTNKKQWLAAIVFSVAPAFVAASTDTQRDHYYELMNLSELKAHEAQALEKGDMQAVATYSLAASAIEETDNGLRATPNDLPSDFCANLFTEDQAGELYHVIDPVKDVDWTEFYCAQKTAQVSAEFVPEGTKVETIMKNGHVETTKTAGKDGGYRLRNPDGEQYLVEPDVFASSYADNGDGTFSPISEPRKVVDVHENVSFTASWNEKMYIKDGGVIVNNGPGDMYGIQGQEYHNTYKKINGPFV